MLPEISLHVHQQNSWVLFLCVLNFRRIAALISISSTWVISARACQRRTVQVQVRGQVQTSLVRFSFGCLRSEFRFNYGLSTSIILRYTLNNSFRPCFRLPYSIYLSRMYIFLHVEIFFPILVLFNFRTKLWAKQESCGECFSDVITHLVFKISCRKSILMKI